MSRVAESFKPLSLDDPKPYFARLHEFERTHWWSKAMWRLETRVLDHRLRGKSSLRALDVGCGAGFHLERLRGRREITEVYGIEPSGVALDHARGSNPSNPSIVKGTALLLPFETGGFDLVTFLDVMQHLPPDGFRTAVAEARRVLRHGGFTFVRSNRETAGGLRGMVREFESQGFQIRHASHVNMIPSLAREIVGIPRRLLGRDWTPTEAAGGLPRRDSSTAARETAEALGRFEAWAVGRARIRLPFGHGTIVSAVKDA